MQSHAQMPAQPNGQHGQMVTANDMTSIGAIKAHGALFVASGASNSKFAKVKGHNNA